MIFFAILAGALLVLTAQQARDRFRHRSRRHFDRECYYCGKHVKRPHLVVSRRDDDVERELSAWGGTAVSAEYCAAHCPGGCQRRHRGKLAA